MVLATCGIWLTQCKFDQALSRLTERSKDLPGAPLDEDMLKWFLRDRDFDIDEAVDKLRKATKWREKVRPDALSEDDVFQQISLGKGYIHESLDRFGRPVLVVRVAKHFAGKTADIFSLRRSKHLEIM